MSTSYLVNDLLHLLCECSDTVLPVVVDVYVYLNKYRPVSCNDTTWHMVLLYTVQILLLLLDVAVRHSAVYFSSI